MPVSPRVVSRGQAFFICDSEIIHYLGHRVRGVAPLCWVRQRVPHRAADCDAACYKHACSHCYSVASTDAHAVGASTRSIRNTIAHADAHDEPALPIRVRN